MAEASENKVSGSLCMSRGLSQDAGAAAIDRNPECSVACGRTLGVSSGGPASHIGAQARVGHRISGSDHAGEGHSGRW